METDYHIPGINVDITGKSLYRHYNTITDKDGYFSILLPERESYDIRLVDTDGEFNGGFFRHNTITIPLSDKNNLLNIGLERENDVTIHGIVRSDKNNKPVSGIRLLIKIPETNVQYKTSTGDDGVFLIRVPERDSYSIIFEDITTTAFKDKVTEFTLSDVNDYLNIVMEEENIITLRGVVRSAKTGELFDGIGVRFSQRHFALTNYEGYFEIRIPEREEYAITFNDMKRNLSIGDRIINITLPYDNTILYFDIDR